jgi:hypothetical protein
LSAICFCIPSYVHQQLSSIDCQNLFMTTLQYLFFLLISASLKVQGFIFEGDLQFSDLFEKTICKGECTLKCTHFIPFTHLHVLNFSPIRILKEALHMHMYSAVLRIRDVYPGSRIRLFSIPDPGSELSLSRIPDPHQSI